VRWYSPLDDSVAGETAQDEINEFFKTILQSKRLRPEDKRDLEVIARLQSKVDSEIDEARKLARSQARKVYTCEGCGLQVMGILAFAEHDEATGHMTNRGKKVSLQGHL
jgi:hypothetical protein